MSESGRMITADRSPMLSPAGDQPTGLEPVLSGWQNTAPGQWHRTLMYWYAAKPGFSIYLSLVVGTDTRPSGLCGWSMSIRADGPGGPGSARRGYLLGIRRVVKAIGAHRMVADSIREMESLAVAAGAPEVAAFSISFGSIRFATGPFTDMLRYLLPKSAALNLRLTKLDRIGGVYMLDYEKHP